MDEVYGDHHHIHQNLGMHLTEGITKNAIWQEH
jgi:hypothetical protein